MQTVNSNVVRPNAQAIGVDPTGKRAATLSDEDARHWDLIRTPLGEEWSGRTRYAAAMYLYQMGELSADVLEVYRVCSRLDSEDPVALIRAQHPCAMAQDLRTGRTEPRSPTVAPNDAQKSGARFTGRTDERSRGRL